MRRQKLEASQSGLLDDESLDIRDILTSAVSRVPMVGGLLAEIVDPPEANAGASIIYGPEREENFRRWFGDSVVKDREGNPIVFYHGTQRNFDRFDPDAGSTSLADDTVGTGAMFFTQDRKFADEFAGRMPNYVRDEDGEFVLDEDGKRIDEYRGQTMPVYLNVENPMVYTGGRYDAETMKERIEEAKAEGYDALIMKDFTDYGNPYTMPRYRQNEVIIFDPRKVKSIHNRGTYNPDDPDLLGMNTMNMSLLYG